MDLEYQIFGPENAALFKFICVCVYRICSFLNKHFVFRGSYGINKTGHQFPHVKIPTVTLSFNVEAKNTLNFIIWLPWKTGLQPPEA